MYIHICICTLGLYERDNGKEHGNSHIIIGYVLGLFRVKGLGWLGEGLGHSQDTSRHPLRWPFRITKMQHIS